MEQVEGWKGEKTDKVKSSMEIDSKTEKIWKVRWYSVDRCCSLGRNYGRSQAGVETLYALLSISDLE